MNDNFSWDPQQNDDEAFGDRPVEMGDNGQWQDVQTVAPPPQPAQARPAQPKPDPRKTAAQIEEERRPKNVEPEIEPDEQEDDDFSAVLSDAKLRLAMGTLWEMLMNNNLFQDLDVDPKAVKTVERKVKNFAKEQMEIMLGMRQDPKNAPAVEGFISSPFNDLEVEVLRAMASTFSKGATQAPEAQTFSGPQAPPRKSSLTPIGPRTGLTTKPAQRALPKTPTAPIQRKRSAAEEQILAEEGVTREELEAVFPDGYTPIQKPLDQLTEAERAARMKETAKRIKGQVKSQSAIPMPDQEQVNAMVLNRVQQDINQAAANPVASKLMNYVLNKK